MAATAILASCSKNAETVTNPEPADGLQVMFTLSAGDQTRAFFDNTAEAETWEKEVKTMTVYVFNQSGDAILRRVLSTSEIAAKSASLTLPNSAAGTTCSFYVVANADYGTVASTTAIGTLTETEVLGSYNAAMATVSSGAARPGGFIMTGSNTASILDGATTNVAVTIKRVVAKIAVRISVDPTFSTTYGGGTVSISSAKISKSSAKSYSFPQTAMYSPRTLYEFSQASATSGLYKNNLFYIYENDALAEGDRVLLTLTGVFDADGNMGTTADQLPVEYQVELSGATGGEIKRNGYYRIEANIKGLSGDGVIVNFTVADWETPVTQAVDLGV